MSRPRIVIPENAAFTTRGMMSEGIDTLNAAIYGDFGAGKSHFCGTVDELMEEKMTTDPIKLVLPEGMTASYRTLFADAEKGGRGLPAEFTDIIMVPLYTYDEYVRLFNFLKIHSDLVAAGDTQKLISLQSQFFKMPVDSITDLWVFGAVIVDSLTEIQKFCLYKLLNMVPGADLANVPETMQIKQWGNALEMILLMIRSFRSLPIIKLFVIQSVEDTDDRKQLYYRPALQGAAKQNVPGFFDVFGFYVLKVDPASGTVTRRLYLLPVGAFKAKHRFENFTGTHLDNPRMRDFQKYTIAQK